MFSEQLIIIMKKIYTAALVICSLGLAKSQVYETVDMGFMTDVSNNGVAVGNIMYGIILCGERLEVQL